MDIVDKTRRSEMMAGIKGKDTAPEMRVRRAAHALGYRFRLHRRDLPSNPDLVFPGRRKVILVHGCYWHRHEGCRLAYEPKSNQEFWIEKFAKNVTRDRRAMTDLVAGGWDPLVVWECETLDAKILNERITSHLGAHGDNGVQA